MSPYLFTFYLKRKYFELHSLYDQKNLRVHTYITFKALKGVLKTPIFPTILKPFNDHGAESYSDQPEIFTSDSSYFFIIKGFCMNFFLSSGYKDIKKEAGHLWTGYRAIFYFSS